MTHPEITNPKYRKLLANEILILRHNFPGEMKSDFVTGILVGLETILRRLSNAEYMESL